ASPKLQCRLPRAARCSQNPRQNITPAVADCRYRAPLIPRLRGNFMTDLYEIPTIPSGLSSIVYRYSRCLSTAFAFPASEFLKKFCQHLAAFLPQDAPLHLYLMVEFRHLQKIQDRSCAACFRIHGSDHDPSHPGLYDGSSTHLAGLQSNVHSTVLQTPVPCLFAGFADRVQLRVGKGILVRISAVIAP